MCVCVNVVGCVPDCHIQLPSHNARCCAMLSCALICCVPPCCHTPHLHTHTHTTYHKTHHTSHTGSFLIDFWGRRQHIYDPSVKPYSGRLADMLEQDPLFRAKRLGSEPPTFTCVGCGCGGQHGGAAVVLRVYAVFADLCHECLCAEAQQSLSTLCG